MRGMETGIEWCASNEIRFLVEDAQVIESRNSTVGFARRTRKNLMKVMRGFKEGEDFHVVTHLVNSLLGIVVVPKERYSGVQPLSLPLEELHQDDWPKWVILLDDPKRNQERTETLDALVAHLRNATAHGRFSFTGDSESRNLEEVWLIVEDRPKPIPRWDVHFGEIDDDRKDSTAPHITCRPQPGGHRWCGLAICTFHLGFSLGRG